MTGEKVTGPRVADRAGAELAGGKGRLVCISGVWAGLFLVATECTGQTAGFGAGAIDVPYGGR